jgi:hypothetical protein
MGVIKSSPRRSTRSGELNPDREVDVVARRRRDALGGPVGIAEEAERLRKPSWLRRITPVGLPCD